jgi:Zn-dependent metalloprotease
MRLALGAFGRPASTVLTYRSVEGFRVHDTGGRAHDIGRCSAGVLTHDMMTSVRPGSGALIAGRIRHAKSTMAGTSMIVRRISSCVLVFALVGLAGPSSWAQMQRIQRPPRGERQAPPGKGLAKKLKSIGRAPRGEGRREKIDPQALDAVERLRGNARRGLRATFGNKGKVKALYGKLGRYGASEQGARTFLRDNGKAFGLRADLADLVKRVQDATPGGERLSFQQFHKGVKVHGATLNVIFDRAGEVSVAGGDYVEDVDVDPNPTVREPDALAAARDALPEPPAGEPTARELVIYSDDAGVSRLTYRFLQPTVNPEGQSGTYETFVDATTGRLVEPPNDVNQYATGRIFTKGNPMAATGDFGLRDGSAIPASAYTTVTLQGLTSSSGLVGQYVDCVTLTPAANRAVPDAAGNYLFDRSVDSVQGAAFDAVMAYHFLDASQRYIQGALGFGNVVNRAIRVNVNGTTADNSFYTSEGAGIGSLTFGSGGVDDAEDAEVILHEYGHAIQDNSSPGIWRTAGTAGVAARTGAMSEGFGDYWAASVLAQHFGQAATPFETAVMEWDGSSYMPNSPPSVRSITSNKRYPQDVTGQVHADGEIWSSVLWRIRGDIGAVAADKAIIQSHFLVTSANSTFVDGANAVVASAEALGYPAAQVSSIRARFEETGILTPAPPTGGTGTTGSTGGTTTGCASSTTAVTFGQPANGTLAATDCTSVLRTTSYKDVYTFRATAGSAHTITMTSSAFDTYLVLVDGAGTVLAQDDDGNGGTNSKIVFTPSATVDVSVEATSYEPRATGPFTLAVAAAAPRPQTADLVTNGSFEAGPSGWVESPPGIVASGGSAPAFQGTFKATLLGRGASGSASLAQGPAFPQAGGQRTLRFRLRIVTSEDASAAYDKMWVRVTNSSGATLATLATYSNVNQAAYGSWAQVTVTIPTGLAVPGNRIRFYATEDNVYPTAFLIDEVSVQ